MDLTPQVINEVEFSMARRGYDPDQVDEFLEKVAVAVGEANDRLAQLHERVVAAERRSAEAEQRAAARAERVVEAPAPVAPGGITPAAEAELETLKRTLLLAQRTADAAVREAEDEARRLVAEAEQQARAAHEEARRAVLDEIAQLEDSRGGLRTEVDALGRHLDGQRSRLQSAITDLQRILDEPVGLQPIPAPAMAAAPAVLLVQADEPTVVDDVDLDELDAPAPAATPAFVLAEEDDEAWARFGVEDEEDAGPPTEPVLRLDRIERASDDDDAYLSELRKAMLDDTGAPDASELGIYDDADVGRAARTGRFGRRR